MFKNFLVRSLLHDYNVILEDNFVTLLQKQIKQGDVIFIDANVKNLYEKHLDSVLKDYKYLLLQPSEEQKNYIQLTPIIEYLIKNNFKKNNRLIAIGGGITQDITGFVASIIYRGVDWIFYPTTLLAQCDSCIGSKTSINFGKYKNQIGNFYPPKEIIIDVGFLNTLSELDIRSGLGEMIHFFLVSGEEDFNRIRQEYKASLQNRDTLRALIYRSLEIKKKVIEIDEFDRAERQVFNYGHSFGHAIESLTNYRIPHGIAVSYGMDIANCISQKLGYISIDLRQKVRKLLEMNWDGTKLGEIDIIDFADALCKDKKNIGSEIKVILTRGLGQMFKDTLPLNNKVLGWIAKFFKTQKD